MHACMARDAIRIHYQREKTEGRFSAVEAGGKLSHIVIMACP
jgi:hypothetical protein